MIKDALFGLAVGDALGVPVEFMRREIIDQNPVTDMKGYGSHNQPVGTWSDDSSLAFCLAEALTQGFSLEEIATNFKKWLFDAYWTAHGEMFDVGITTRNAIMRVDSGTKPELAGGMGESENGNGSLMRILPLLFYIREMPVEERFGHVSATSSITHRHIRSIIACFYYLEFAKHILDGKDKYAAYEALKADIPEFLNSHDITQPEIQRFHRLLNGNIYELPREVIPSSGYVVDTLESSIWCLLTTGTYKDAVLKAVNLGNDTDTTACVTGGLAGMLYGFDNIPANWVERLVRRGDIEDLAVRLSAKLAQG